ncbi:MAG: glycosyltransferase family 39 protein [Planctomycetes bacterium]|nr:glycosyltransferase family 39 protein [Planctomycetota bacterium]
MSKRTATGLALLLLLAAALRLVFFTGLLIGDDIVYSRIAVDRLNGKVDVTNVQQTRSGFLLPILVSYALFGAGELPLVLYNLLCSTALVGAAFALGRILFGDVAGLLAGLLAAVHPNLVRFATECHTDTPLALWVALAVLVIYTARMSDPGARRRILTGLLLGWAYLHKESTIYMGLFFAGHWWATRRAWTWYLPIALTLAGVMAAEMIGFASLTGDPLARYSMIRFWHAGQYMAERYTTVGSILHRQFLELPLLMFTPWYGRNFTGLINLACLFGGLGLLWKRVPGTGMIWVWFLAFYAGYCFWPSSLRPFMPGFFLFEWTLPVFGAPLAVLFGGFAAQVRPRTAGAVAAGVLLAALVTIHSGRGEGRPLSAGAREARAWIAKEKIARIVTDDKTVEALDFIEGHRPSRLYIPFQEATDFAGAAVIVDKFWSQPGKWWSRPVPEIALHPPASWTKVHETERIVVYRPR